MMTRRHYLIGERLGPTRTDDPGELILVKNWVSELDALFDRENK